jgi:hypothetical protein
MPLPAISTTRYSTLTNAPGGSINPNITNLVCNLQNALRAFGVRIPTVGSDERRVFVLGLSILIREDQKTVQRRIAPLKKYNAPLYWVLKTASEILKKSAKWEAHGSRAYILAAAEIEAINSFGVVHPPSTNHRRIITMMLDLWDPYAQDKFKDKLQLLKVKNNLELTYALEAAHYVLARNLSSPDYDSTFDQEKTTDKWKESTGPNSHFSAEVMCEIEQVAFRGFNERLREVKLNNMGNTLSIAIVHDANNLAMVVRELFLPGIQDEGYPYLQEQIEAAERKYEEQKKKPESAKYMLILHALNFVDGYIRTNVFKEYASQALTTHEMPFPPVTATPRIHSFAHSACA